MTAARQGQSNPMPNEAAWKKESPTLYVDTSGRFRIEGHRVTAHHIEGWTVADSTTGRTRKVAGFRQGKALVTRLLFEESPEWSDD